MIYKKTIVPIKDGEKILGRLIQYRVFGILVAQKSILLPNREELDGRDYYITF